MDLHIGSIVIGQDKDVLVIPEIGINHNGNLKTAKEMVDSAYRSGAKLIKHQTHICEDEMSKDAKSVIPGNASISIYDIMSKCALNEEEELELKEYVEAKNMVFLSTPFSRAAAERLERFGVKAYKIGSGEMNNYPLIEQISEYGKPMIVSTGMNDLTSIEKTIKIMEKHGISYALMHTTNLYPTKPQQVRLGAMLEMMQAFPGVPIGLSDHTINNNACIAAIALGAALVERHFTDTMDREGPDIVCSMDERSLSELIAASKEIKLMRGGCKKPIPEEKVTSDFAFASVVTTDKIRKGELFSKDNLWVKRPGTGEINAEQYKNLLGKNAACDIECDVQLKWNMVEG
ncbi:MAG: N-acetylneuraminate synthase family protein [Lachnospiraceae bacterium]|nr:N-acetylneuraminate synthase family protein [Lachnospiraceae bacterium]